MAGKAPRPPETARSRQWRAAERHTRRVRRLRILLPVAATVLTLFIAAWTVVPNLFPSLQGFSISMDGLVMNNPRLSGQLGPDRRYSVTARRAIQSLLDPSKLTLDHLVAEIDLGADGWVRITGRAARFDTETQILNLEDGIALTSSEGYEAVMESAVVHLGEGRLESPEPLRMRSPRGVIDAGRIHIERDGDVIRMRGGVKVVIAPAAETSEDQR